MQKNVLGTELQTCSCEPTPGFYRDGLCRTDPADRGVHTVCALVTTDFLEFSKAQGNDLSTPRPEFGFAGLNDGDQWCLCAGRWYDAYKEGLAPKVILDACDEETLAIIPLEALMKNKVK
jgi:uncharacterized protein (DUF2237 family)